MFALFPLQIKRVSVICEDVTDVGLISQCVRVKLVNLSQNSITDIRELRHLRRLQELHLSNNHIADLLSLAWLSKCPELRILNLVGNPVCQQQHFGAFICKLLPQVSGRVVVGSGWRAGYQGVW